MLLLIDNYDSFSYNLYQLLGGINPDIKVVRNDSIDVFEIEDLQPSHIVLSPGPGKPSESGICEDVIRVFGGRIPILGVCLGHQAICEVYGGVVTYAKRLMHGKPSRIELSADCALFDGLPKSIIGARYHSLSLKEGTLPEALEITARSDDGEIMGVQHKEYELYGLQFHPESVLTPNGETILRNFLHEQTK